MENIEVIPKKLDKKYIFFTRLKRKLFKHVWLTRTLILAFIAGLVVLLAVSLNSFLKQIGINNYTSAVASFIFQPQSEIKSSTGRVNFLILGIGGQGHAGGDLTDTMIFASISLDHPSVVFVSLPRDIWIPEIRAKINSAYYWGNQKEANGGFVLAKSITEEVVGQPIDYALVMDFSGFTKIIDVLGGVEINIERSFVDESYPVAGKENDACSGDPQFRCRYETVSFTKGLTLMDGDTALKFARSRYAKGDEGTDLARAARQEKIIQAVKNKIFSKNFFLSPKKVIAVWQAVRESVQTDLSGNALAILARRILAGRNNIVQTTLPLDLLVNPPISSTYDNQYVFVPKDGNWDEIHKWINSLF